jgi:hypothetical protein
MRLNKFLSLVLCVTLFSVLYVYQQSEIMRLAYAGEKHQSVFQELLDKNSILRYNIEKSASLVNIAGSVSEGAQFQMPEKYQLVRLVPSRTGATFAQALPSKETLLSKVFGLKSQAEAKTINQ